MFEYYRDSEIFSDRKSLFLKSDTETNILANIQITLRTVKVIIIKGVIIFDNGFQLYSNTIFVAM
jgi:hypothetical protein